MNTEFCCGGLLDNILLEVQEVHVRISLKYRLIII
jgi:hypothetical protein